MSKYAFYSIILFAVLIGAYAYSQDSTTDLKNNLTQSNTIENKTMPDSSSTETKQEAKNSAPASITKETTPNKDNQEDANSNSSGSTTKDSKTVNPASDQTQSNEKIQKPVTTGLSNTKKGWGLKVNSSHQQPEMPSSITATLNKYNSYWIGSPNEKVVYLTFDEGYENGYSNRILDILKANNVKAAFFITGHYLKSQPELVKRMSDEGHIIGNHTDTHPSLPEVSDEQIKKELQVVESGYKQITGQENMKYLRPPKGEYSERTLALTKDLGYHNIFWSMALVDWVPMKGGPQEAYDHVINNLHNGALILLHAVSKDDTEALDRIIKDTKEQGYVFKSLDELVKQ
jgi:peptidoglycan-N-acetylmuramic acid deacetylase